MLERTQRNILVFSRLLQNRRKFLSHLSALGMSVDLHPNEDETVYAAHATNHLVMVDLENSEWGITTWLKNLRSTDRHTEAIFLTSDYESQTTEKFMGPDEEGCRRVMYYCVKEKNLFQNSSAELHRILERFASVA